MVRYSENELFSITDFTKQIGTLSKKIKDNTLEKIGILKNNHLEIVVISTKEYNRLKAIEENANNSRWEYWKEEELDNFGKISIGLSKHNYDDEDYSTW